MEKKVSIFGVRIDTLRLEETINKIDFLLNNHHRSIITHVHSTGLNIAYEQAWFRDFLNQASLVYCDGMGVKLGALLTGQKIPERYTLADWIWPLASISESKGYRWFFLGNPPGNAQNAANLINQKHPNLIFTGTFHGFFNKSQDSFENAMVIKKINESNPDLLFVGFGMPAQERWIKDNWGRINVPVIITCGGLFEVLTGNSVRGPSWMHQNYMEWFVRLFFSPKKYGRRYLHDVPIFLYRVMKQRFIGNNNSSRS